MKTSIAILTLALTSAFSFFTVSAHAAEQNALVDVRFTCSTNSIYEDKGQTVKFVLPRDEDQAMGALGSDWQCLLNQAFHNFYFANHEVGDTTIDDREPPSLVIHVNADGSAIGGQQAKIYLPELVPGFEKTLSHSSGGKTITCKLKVIGYASMLDVDFFNRANQQCGVPAIAN